MSQSTYPRSSKVLLGGIAHLGRFIDKIRLRNAGQIQDYNYITVGFDKYLVDFLGIDPQAFEQCVLAGGDIANKRGVALSSLWSVTTWADVIDLDEGRL